MVLQVVFCLWLGFGMILRGLVLCVMIMFVCLIGRIEIEDEGSFKEVS